MDAGMGLEIPFGDGLNDAIWNEYQKGVHVLDHLRTGGLNKQ